LANIDISKRDSERSFESSMANNVRSLHDTSLASSEAGEVRSRFRIEWSLCYHGEGWIAWEPATKRLSRSRAFIGSRSVSLHLSPRGWRAV